MSNLNLPEDLYDQMFPVYGDDYFGRIQTEKIIQERLLRGQPQAIFALNKMGKTSFVRNLADRLRNQLVVFIDMQMVVDSKDLYFEIIKNLYDDLKSKWPHINVKSLNLLSDENLNSPNLQRDFTQDIESLYQALKSEIDYPRFIIFIDEVDRLLMSDFKDYGDFLLTLRDISQRGQFLNFAVVGLQPRINREVQIAGFDNVGFQMFEEFFLPPLTKEGCKKMICEIGQRMGLHYEDEALDQVYIESGGNPFLARQLCSLVWQEIKPKTVNEMSGFIVGKTNILITVDKFIRHGKQGAYLEAVWLSRLNSSERNLLELIVTADHFIPRHDKDTKILEDLVERHIIVTKNGYFKLGADLFRRWIRKFVAYLD